MSISSNPSVSVLCERHVHCMPKWTFYPLQNKHLEMTRAGIYSRHDCILAIAAMNGWQAADCGPGVVTMRKGGVGRPGCEWM